MAEKELDLPRIEKIISILQASVVGMVEPASCLIVAKYGRDPFLVLVSCILSLRTKDLVSYPASCRLFECAQTPQALLSLSVSQIEKLIYPVGFYRTKAKNLHAISYILLERYEGLVPNDEEALLSLPGVGRKTMNLVLAEGFGMPAICVDVHVHRISNRLAIVKTETPEQTETELKRILPEKYWREFNRLLVMWGQNICVPVSPFCSICPLAPVCPKINVKSSR